MLPLQPSVIRDNPTPLLSVLLQGRGKLPHPPSDVRDDDPLLSSLLHRRVNPPLQTSAVKTPPLPQLLALHLQRDVPPLQPLAARDTSPPLSVLLQG